MKYHNNSNKRHRLQLKSMATVLSDKHRYSITAPVEHGRNVEYTYPINVTTVYSSRRILTFIRENNSALVLSDGSPIERIPLDVLDILGI